VLASGKEDSKSRPAHTLSFSVVFPHEEDDVYLAHFFPYSHRDQKLDLERWCQDRAVDEAGEQTVEKLVEVPQHPSWSQGVGCRRRWYEEKAPGQVPGGTG